MTLPALVLGFIISTVLGVVFHLLRGGGAGRLLLYLILGWTGFWTGQFLATRLGWAFGSVGPLRLGAAAVVSVIFLLIGHWLSLVETDKKNTPR